MCISLNRLLVYHLDGIFTCKGDRQPNTKNEADEQVMLFHIANHRHRHKAYFTDILTTGICLMPTYFRHLETLRICSLSVPPRYHHRDV